MRRVLVIGSGGSGKTTFARRLAQATGLPLVHLDSLYWRRGWDPTPDREWDQIIAGLIARDEWIIDGNYGRTLAARLAVCDTVVYLDVAPWRCVWRIVRRRWQYAGRERPDLPAGCPERLTWEFLAWVWTYRKRRRPGILRALSEVADRVQVVVLRSKGDAEAFLTGSGASYRG
jgi:adenylate kinase family enzyme